MDRLVVAILVLVVVIAASDVAQLPPGQVYWKKVLPNTPMPLAIKNLLKQDGDNVTIDRARPWNYHTHSGTKTRYDPDSARPWNYRTHSGTKTRYDPDSARPWNYRTQSGTKTRYDPDSARPWNYRTQSGTKTRYDPDRARPWNYRTHSETKTRYDSDRAIFFVEKDLQTGTRMTLHFTDPTIWSPPFISRSEADLLPFTSSKLPEILDHFSMQPNSKGAESVRSTLTECDEPALEGEKRHCATSLESMIDFSTTTLGSHDVIALSNAIDRENSPKQQYEIISFQAQKKMAGYSSVVCHASSYAYAVFSCHTTVEAKTYQVSLVGKDGTRVETVATCHYDTSTWDPTFFAFRMLGVKPGTVPICHFLPQNDVVWTRRM